MHPHHFGNAHSKADGHHCGKPLRHGGHGQGYGRDQHFRCVSFLDQGDQEQRAAEKQGQDAEDGPKLSQPFLQRRQLPGTFLDHGGDPADLSVHPRCGDDPFSPSAGNDRGHIRHIPPVSQRGFPFRRGQISRVLFHRKGFPGQRGFFRLHPTGPGQPEIRRDLAASIQTDHISGNQLRSLDLPLLSLPDTEGPRTCQLFQGIQRPLRFSLLQHPNHGVHADHHGDDRRIADLMQHEGNDRRRHQHIDQRIVQLLQEPFRSALFLSLPQLVRPEDLPPPGRLLLRQPPVRIRLQKRADLPDRFCLISLSRLMFHPCIPP